MSHFTKIGNTPFTLPFQDKVQIHERPTVTLKTVDRTPAVHLRREDSDVLGYYSK